MVTEASVLLVVTPTDAAVAAAETIAAACAQTGARPLVADLNAISPVTAHRVAAVLARLDVVDGSISGPPPTVQPGARVYLSGPRACEVAELGWTHAEPVAVSDRIGDASAQDVHRIRLQGSDSDPDRSGTRSRPLRRTQ